MGMAMVGGRCFGCAGCVLHIFVPVAVVVVVAGEFAQRQVRTFARIADAAAIEML